MIGLEIGTVSIKWAKKKEDGGYIFGSERHEGNPIDKIKSHLSPNLIKDNYSIVGTGRTIRTILDVPYKSEIECLEKSISYHNLKPDILLSLGGETFLVYTIKDGRIVDIISSSKCAAGTGEFIIQQFKRMNLTLEQGIEISRHGKLVPLATRCSVYCKSDATHKLNKGDCCPADVASTLIDDLAKKVNELIKLTQAPFKHILLSGGLSLNTAFVEHLKKYLNHSKITVLEESPYLEAFGAALYASELENSVPVMNIINGKRKSLELLESLKTAEGYLDYRVQDMRAKDISPNASYILGVDAGSTTTKAILFDMNDTSIVANCYLRTHGDPINATQKCLLELEKQIKKQPIKIVQAAVTGSGREIVSVYLGNCLSFNEILAHSKAASDEVPEVDTVFEIGGQDSKFVSFLNGIPIDYSMNEGCSAGTGSFLEESVSTDMGIPVREISKIAESSNQPIAFGERCAAFINTDLRNAIQQGARQNDVIAGLVCSIARNYIVRIVGNRNLGDTILFQGGVALNRSVALALAMITQRKIVVPPLPELMGCVGVCLLTVEMLNRKEVKIKKYNLEELIQSEMKTKGTFKCNSCDYKCEINKIMVRDKTYPFGGLCSKYELIRQEKKDIKEGKNFIAMRNKIMFEDFGAQEMKKPNGTIGVPLALSAMEFYPFYAKLINELGYNVVLSKPSGTIDNSKINGEFCYPMEVTHGTVDSLLDKNVDFILLPYFLEGMMAKDEKYAYSCPSSSKAPDLLRASFPDLTKKILKPHIGFSQRMEKTTIKEITKLASILGVGKKDAMHAGKKAFVHYNKFKKKYRETAHENINEIISEPTVIIAGKPYVVCSNEINLAMPRKICSRGYHVISADMLPSINRKKHPRNVWYFTRQTINAIEYIKKYSNIHICILSCFSCVPDAMINHSIFEKLRGYTFCYLEIDSHTAHAGFETRVGAFLDILENKKNGYETVQHSN